MPHVIVKLLPGRSEKQKERLAEQIVRDVVATLDSQENSVSVAIEEIDPADWDAAVYEADIATRFSTLYKKPGYGRLK
jgi:4-oxalocrotonate tautomerase